ncbi:hypothetical protein MKK63_22500 [Methylobacterium sp. J-088]|uniref:hypothetical protein n=1 Tax=Methylobacterium sp. J-088 TaxID=2836664 RepID=UPI001FB9113B|nr:hypothetical protein [Methylobacterium sp. J-088]MCJ2065460.1 hypothetical protein [Methylobacterium sp. J-088]
MMSEVDCDFEHSPLSGPVTRDGETVEIEIYRFPGSPECWRMEVVHTSGCIRWDTTFATDTDARAAFEAMLEAVGIASFVGIRPKAWN